MRLLKMRELLSFNHRGTVRDIKLLSTVNDDWVFVYDAYIVMLAMILLILIVDLLIDMFTAASIFTIMTYVKHILHYYIPEGLPFYVKSHYGSQSKF